MSESPLSLCRLDLAQINDYILRVDSHVHSEVVSYQTRGVYSGILPQCDLGQVHSPQYHLVHFDPTPPFFLPSRLHVPHRRQPVRAILVDSSRLRMLLMFHSED